MPPILRNVPIGAIEISDDSSEVLVAYGLGSCIAVCAYDRVARVGGMLHALLPTDASVNGDRPAPAKYVDQGVPLLLDALLHTGARRHRLIVSLCGGACVIPAKEFSDILGIGERNILAAQEALRAAHLRVHAQDTGGDAGRTVKLNMVNGQVTVKTLARGERVLIAK